MTVLPVTTTESGSTPSRSSAARAVAVGARYSEDSWLVSRRFISSG